MCKMLYFFHLWSRECNVGMFGLAVIFSLRE